MHLEQGHASIWKFSFVSGARLGNRERQCNGFLVVGAPRKFIPPHLHTPNPGHLHTSTLSQQHGGPVEGITSMVPGIIKAVVALAAFAGLSVN